MSDGFLELDDELLAELLGIFAVEAEEHLRVMADGLLAIEQSTDGPGLDEVFRAAHSLKGASRSVGLERAEAIAHALESVFAALQADSEAFDTSEFTFLYTAIDLLSGLIAAGNNPSDDQLRLVPEVVADLTRMHAGDAAPAPPPPVAPAAAPSPPFAPTSPPASSTAVWRVLVAEDSRTIRAMQRQVLEQAGHFVVMTADGEEAWSILQNNDFDILVSDVQMPRLDGWELTSRVRAEPRFADMPILLLTSLDGDEDRARSREVGADAHMSKARFDGQALLSEIERLL